MLSHHSYCCVATLPIIPPRRQVTRGTTGGASPFRRTSTKKDEQRENRCSSSLCHIVPNYRTFIEDYLKILDFIDWLKVAYPEKATFLTESLDFSLWCPNNTDRLCNNQKVYYFCDTYSPNRYRTTTLDKMGWFINCLVMQCIAMRVPALRRQWDVVVPDSV